MSERLEIDALRALLTIAKHGGVTRAASHLNVSQSAVSHKIRRLEQNLDCSLLTRRPGEPLFTDAGARLCDYARRIVDLHDEALATLGKKPVSGKIMLGMTEDTTTSGIARILGRFMRLFPNVKVQTRTSQSLCVQEWLRAGDLDVAVMQIFRKDILPEDLILFEDTLHWVRSPDLELETDLSIPFLSFDNYCFYKRWAFSEGLSMGHTFESILECPSSAGIQSAVRSGLGVALLNGLHITPDISIIEGIFPKPPDIVFIARVRAGSDSAAVKALVSEIGKEVQASSPLKLAG
ncbi:LysR family transcriptional regulator [Roseibium sp. HPY-6]|uniref:LysR family transcriptional regulator n=1 Tax=Roseibium sp. HPY-6 TaxID=3229852 RepID=UPI00338D7A69